MSPQREGSWLSTTTRNYGTSIISASSKQKMFKPGMRNYGYGFIIDSAENHFRIWHNGGIPGFSANISRFVNDDICTIVLSNRHRKD